MDSYLRFSISNTDGKSHYVDAVDNIDMDAYTFIRRILRRTRISCSTFLVSLFYVERSRSFHDTQKRRIRLNSSNSYNNRTNSTEYRTLTNLSVDENFIGTDRYGSSIIPTFLGSVIVADKYLYDGN